MIKNDYCQNGVFVEEEDGRPIIVTYEACGMSDKCIRETDKVKILTERCLNCGLPIEECPRFKGDNVIF